MYFFLFLFTTCTSIIFFSSISYCKNLCTYFRIRINVLIVLEFILICFVGYFYHKRTWHTDKPNCFGQKNTERIRICVLFFYISLLYFGNAIATNQLQQFSPLFRQWHYHKPTATIFFSSYFSNAIATNPFHIFFFLRNNMCTQFLQQILSDKLLLVVIIGLKK